MCKIRGPYSMPVWLQVIKPGKFYQLGVCFGVYMCDFCFEWASFWNCDIDFFGHPRANKSIESM